MDEDLPIDIHYNKLLGTTDMQFQLA